jgi:hypothetical protein
MLRMVHVRANANDLGKVSAANLPGRPFWQALHQMDTSRELERSKVTLPPSFIQF